MEKKTEPDKEGESQIFPYDRTLRDLLQGLPEKFIEILTGKRGKRLLDTSFPKTQDKRVDLLVELEDKEIFHLEVQTKDEKDMPYRMLLYRLLIRERYGRKRGYGSRVPILQMVLYIGDDKRREEDIVHTIDEEDLWYTYKVRHIYNIDCRPLIESESIDDNILATLCNIENPIYFWNKLKHKLNRLNDKKRKDYMRKLFMLLRLRPDLKDELEKIDKEVGEMPLTIIDKKRDPLYKMGVEEGIEKGMEKGMEKGIERGLRIALDIKFGKEGVEFFDKKIKGLPLEKLEILKDNLKNAKSIEELEILLGLREG